MQSSHALNMSPGVAAAALPRPGHVTQQIVSWYPRILVFPGFVDNSTAAHIIALAKRRMAPSGLAWRKTDTPDEQQQIRTSSGVFISRWAWMCSTVCSEALIDRDLQGQLSHRCFITLPLSCLGAIRQFVNQSCCCLVSCCSDDDTAGVLRRLEDKIAQVTLLPPSHGEVRAWVWCSRDALAVGVVVMKWLSCTE